MSRYRREGSWHLTCDKFLALYGFNYYSHCVFSVILGGFFGQVSSIMYVFDFLNMKFSLKRGWCRFNNDAKRVGSFNLTRIKGGGVLGNNTNWHTGGGGCIKRLQNLTRIIWMAPYTGISEQRKCRLTNEYSFFLFLIGHWYY